MLLDHGADPTERVRDSSGVTDPLQFAAKIKCEVKVLELLIEHGAHVAHLQSLDLSNQKLEALPRWLLQLPDLKKLTLAGNPLSTVPMSLRSERVAVLLDYLRDIEMTGKVPWVKSKVMVLGKEGVGKTHMLRRLKSASYDRNESTNGLDINEFQLGGKELTWFDFGGQEVFYPTHQFFLTALCVYLIVFRLDAADSEERVQHWLRTVEQFARDPKRPVKIIVVGTHSDALDSPEAQDEVWKRLRPTLNGCDQVVATVGVSCTTGAGFKELQAALLRAIEMGGFSSESVPLTYQQVWEWIVTNRATKPKMDLASFQAEFGSLTELQVNGALRFLADAGLCFYSKHLGLVVTDLQWLATLFREVVSFYSGVKDGVVTLPGLRHNAWKESSAAEIRQHMALLERFQMAFARLEEDSWVVPSMLKEEPAAAQPRGAAQAICRYEHTYELEVVPSGGIGRLMAQLQGNPAVRVMEMWRHGMFVETVADDGQVGSVVLERGYLTQLRVQCFVLRTGVQTLNLIQLLTDECGVMLGALFERAREKPFREFISCPHCLNKPGTLDVVRLSKEQCTRLVVASNQSTFLCGEDVVPVSELRVDVALGNMELLDESVVCVEAEPFAAGGFGIVSRALMGGTVVVVKELNAEKAQRWVQQRDEGRPPLNEVSDAAAALNWEVFREFRNEAAMMSRLRHANIVALHGLMLKPLRLVMEYCAAGDLLLVLERQQVWGGPVNVDDAAAVIPALCWKIICDVARGMAFLHAQQPPIAHRDLRSPNVFLVSLDANAPCCAKVADFGLSVAVTARQTVVLPSWQWMAPEAQQGANYTHLCDLYSFAIVANEVLTQRQPFHECPETYLQLITKVLSEGLRPRIPAFVPTWMRELLQELWSHEAGRRPSFADALYRLENAGARRDVVPAVVRSVQRALVPRVVFENQDWLPLCMTANASEMWMGCRNGDVRVYSTKSAEQLRLERHGDSDVVCILRPSSSIVFSGCSDGMVRAWGSEAGGNKASLSRASLKKAKHSGESADSTVDPNSGASSPRSVGSANMSPDRSPRSDFDFDSARLSIRSHMGRKMSIDVEGDRSKKGAKAVLPVDTEVDTSIQTKPRGGSWFSLSRISSARLSSPALPVEWTGDRSLTPKAERKSFRKSAPFPLEAPEDESRISSARPSSPALPVEWTGDRTATPKAERKSLRRLPPFPLELLEDEALSPTSKAGIYSSPEDENGVVRPLTRAERRPRHRSGHSSPPEDETAVDEVMLRAIEEEPPPKSRSGGLFSTLRQRARDARQALPDSSPDLPESTSSQSSKLERRVRLPAKQRVSLM